MARKDNILNINIVEVDPDASDPINKNALEITEQFTRQEVTRYTARQLREFIDEAKRRVQESDDHLQEMINFVTQVGLNAGFSRAKIENFFDITTDPSIVKTN